MANMYDIILLIFIKNTTPISIKTIETRIS